MQLDASRTAVEAIIQMWTFSGESRDVGDRFVLVYVPAFRLFRQHPVEGEHQRRATFSS